MIARTLLLFVALALFIGCAAPFSTSTATPQPTTSSVQNHTPSSGIPVVSVVAIQNPEVVHPGDKLQVDLNMETWLLEQTKLSDGSAATSLTANANSPVKEMRVCFQFGTPCQPTGNWTPFVRMLSQEFPVDWIGARDLNIVAEFRDAGGSKISTAKEAESPDHRPEMVLTVDSVLDIRTPEAGQPSYVKTAVAATRVAFPVSGSLELEGGRCCAGGKVGSTVGITADFSATSSQGTVTEMRTLSTCATTDEMNKVEWEPFVSSRTYPYKIATGNFVGWYLSVQYRDDKGNLSPVYCDDISVEGMP